MSDCLTVWLSECMSEWVIRRHFDHLKDTTNVQRHDKCPKDKTNVQRTILFLWKKEGEKHGSLYIYNQKKSDFFY